MTEPQQPQKPAAPKTVTMEALTDGSYDGFPFQTGDMIEVEEQYVDAMTASGQAARADRAEVAQKAREAREAAQQAAKTERKNPVTSKSR